MKALLGLIILMFAISIQAQETKEPNWFHLEGVYNQDYKIYLDIGNIEYIPGNTIIASLLFKGYYNNAQNPQYKIKYVISENTYEVLSIFTSFQGNGMSELIQSEIKPIIPGSEMSVIYQGVYIQAVTMGPTRK